MFVFRINYYFITLIFTLIFISSCNRSDTIKSNLIINNNVSKTILINKEKKIKSKNVFIVNNISKVTKKKINLIDGIASNIINENDVVFEFRNERLLQGRENTNLIQNNNEKEAITAVFKMLKRNTNLEKNNVNLKYEKNLIDYLLISKKFQNNPLTRNILVFLPFTGPYANNFGNKIRKAIDLSILRFGSDNIKVIYFDTGKNYLLEEVEILINELKPNLILGPFTRSSVLKIKPFVKLNSIPMFAFTNDIALVEKNIWSMGFSPEEQIDNIMECAVNNGYKSYGLIVPNDLYGKIILDRSIDNLSVNKNTSFSQLVLSNSEMKNKSKLETILKRFLAYNEKKAQVIPSKFDAILIGGNKNFILEIAPLLAFYDIDSKKVKILGTEKFNVKAIKDEPSLEGAWFPILLNKKERNETIIFYEEENILKAIEEELDIANEKYNNRKKINLIIKRQKIFSDRKARIYKKDFKLVWKNTWNDDGDDDYFSRVGFDVGILAINFLNQKKTIEEYIKNIQGLVTGFKFSANGYVKKAISVVEIQKLGEVKKIKKCFYNNLID